MLLTLVQAFELFPGIKKSTGKLPIKRAVIRTWRGHQAQPMATNKSQVDISPIQETRPVYSPLFCTRRPFGQLFVLANLGDGQYGLLDMITTDHNKTKKYRSSF